MDARRREHYDLRLLHMLDVEVRGSLGMASPDTPTSGHQLPWLRLQPRASMARHGAIKWAAWAARPRPARNPAGRVHHSQTALPHVAWPALPRAAPQDYLSRYQELILTASGLDMALPKVQSMLPRPGSEHRNLHLMSAA